MTLLGYVQHLSQTHLSGHLKPKSHPSTPSPTDAAPAAPSGTLETVDEPATGDTPPTVPPKTDETADVGPSTESATPPVPIADDAPVAPAKPEPAPDSPVDGLTSDALPVVDVAAILHPADTPDVTPVDTNAVPTNEPKQTAAPAVAPIEGVPAPVGVVEEIKVEGDSAVEPVVVTDNVTAVAVVEPVRTIFSRCDVAQSQAVRRC